MEPTFYQKKNELSTATVIN